MSVNIAQIREHLFTSVLSDCLDSVGLMKQALPPRIRPLDEASVMVGRARSKLRNGAGMLRQGGANSHGSQRRVDSTGMGLPTLL